MSEGKVIQWFPGHMAKARREITESLAKVDVIFELYDARIPFSSKNPMVDEIVKNKPRVVLLNKAKIADPKVTKLWIDYYANKGILALDIDSVTGYNINKINQYAKMALKELFEKREKRGIMSKTIKAMIIGIPNVGKSTLINKLANRKATQVGDKPGVTKSQTWIKVTEDLFLLDTPGILWPKLDNNDIAHNLASMTAIKEDILDTEDIAIYIINKMLSLYKDNICNRYNITNTEDIVDILDQIGKKIGAIRNNETDYYMVYLKVIKDLQDGYLGKVTFDSITKL